MEGPTRRSILGPVQFLRRALRGALSGAPLPRQDLRHAWACPRSDRAERRALVGPARTSARTKSSPRKSLPLDTEAVAGPRRRIERSSSENDAGRLDLGAAGNVFARLLGAGRVHHSKAEAESGACRGSISRQSGRTTMAHRFEGAGHLEEIVSPRSAGDT